jgi:mRNA interferase MazF
LAHSRGGGLGKSVRGDVFVLIFPFSDLNQSKRRPALVIAELKGEDLSLCQITNRARADGYSITLDAGDFVDGGLNQSSHIRPNRRGSMKS